jgi:hypothetical protein
MTNDSNPKGLRLEGEVFAAKLEGHHHAMPALWSVATAEGTTTDTGFDGHPEGAIS